MTDEPVSIVIVAPVHNRRAITLQCLESLSRIDRTGMSLETVIVDDGSTDGTSDAILSRFPDTILLHGDGNLFYTKATNLGIAEAMRRGADYVLAINDDSVFEPDFLLRLLACAREHPRSVVGALLIRWDDRRQVCQFNPTWSTWRGGWQWPVQPTADEVPTTPVETELLPGNCVLYPRAVIEKVGLMDEKRFPGWGDAEYTPRMRRSGWRLLVEPRARLYMQPNRIRPLLRDMPVGDALREMFLNRLSHKNLCHAFLTCWHGAPSRTQAVLAFTISRARQAGNLFRASRPSGA